MADTVDVDLIVEAITRGFDRVQADLAKVGQSSNRAGKETAEGFNKGKTSAERLRDGITQVGVAVGTVGIAVVALKKTWDFAKQGAQLEFTREKFDRLAESIGTTGDALFKALQRATDGMMSDSQIIGSAVDLISLGLANTHDQAVRLVTVAAKLHMPMNQLVLALTNMTTMRFDQLGVRVEGFEERVKSLEASGMSAAEAFREAFLQQAEAQIKLAGDAADSSVADFLRLEAALGNIGDTAKMKLAPGLASAAEALYLLLTWSKQIDGAIIENDQHILETSNSYDEYRARVTEAREAAGYFVDELGNVYKTASDRAFNNAAEDLRVMSEAEWRAVNAAAAHAENIAKVADTRARESAATQKQIDLENRLAEAKQKQTARRQGLGYAESLNERGIAVQQAAARAMRLLEAGLSAGLSGEIQGAADSYADSIANINERHAQLLEDLDEARRRYGKGSEQVKGLKAEIAGLVGEEREAANAMAEATAQIIFQQAAAGLDAAAALELARAMGLISEADYAVATTIQNLRNQFDQNVDGMIDASEGAAEYAAKIEEVNAVVGALQQQNIPLTAENIASAMQAITEGDLGILAPDKLPAALQAIQEQKTPTAEALGEVKTSAEEIGTATTTAAETATTDLGTIQTQAGLTDEAIGRVTEEVGYLKTALDGLPTSKTITVTVNVVQNGSTSKIDEIGIEGQHGLDFIVPPGFPKDNFPIWASSGERVVVLTRQQQSMANPDGSPARVVAGGGYGRGDTFIINNSTRSSAIMTNSIIRAAKTRKFNNSMG